MEIRILTPKDAEMYKEIRLKGLKNEPTSFGSSFEDECKFSMDRFENRLNGENSLTFGAFVDQQLMGVVTLALEQKPKLKHRATIVGVYTDTENRRMGFGRSLMNEAIRQAKELETIEQLYLTVTSSNEPAKKLYQSLGFETYGVDHKALKIENTYYDEDLMVLKL